MDDSEAGPRRVLRGALIIAAFSPASSPEAPSVAVVAAVRRSMPSRCVEDGCGGCGGGGGDDDEYDSRGRAINVAESTGRARGETERGMATTRVEFEEKEVGAVAVAPPAPAASVPSTAADDDSVE